MPVEIPLSKSKLILTLLGCIAFVAAGFWFIIHPPTKIYGIFSNPTLVKAIGVASILLFGTIGVYIVKKLGDKLPGLVISGDGIQDNASAISAGFIPWVDVLAIQENVVSNQRFINVIVKNPQDYIAKQTNAFKRKLAQMNYNQYNTVIAIPAIGLKCNFDELKGILEKGFSDYKENKMIE